MRALRGRAALVAAVIACAAAAPDRASGPFDCPAPRRDGATGALVSVACEPAAGAPLDGAAGLLFGIPIDVNRADARSLDVLPGIGPGRAAEIVRERANAPFCSVAELARVAGVGPVTVARVAPFVAASPAPGCSGS